MPQVLRIWPLGIPMPVERRKRTGDEEDVMEEVEEEAVVEAKEVKVSLLLWLSRGQRRQGVRCNNPLTLPQCPVSEMRETS